MIYEVLLCAGARKNAESFFLFVFPVFRVRTRRLRGANKPTSKGSF
jgi:hypothetical protein